MTAASGRDLRISYASDGTTFAAVAGARTDSLTINAEMVDITDKDHDAVRTLLNDVAVKSMALSVTGVAKTEVFAELVLAASATTSLHKFRVAFGTVSTYTADFFITSFEMTGEQADTITFTMSLESSGAITVA